MRSFLRPPSFRLLPAVSLTLLLAACKVGPDYVKPAITPTAGYKETAPDGGIWKVAEPGDRAVRGKWWTVYNDPLLNALQDVATSSNEDLKLAESQYRQARALAQSARSGYFPTVTAGAAVTRFRDSRNVFNASANTGPANVYSLPLDVSWEIDIWGRVRRAVESSEASAQASAAQLASIQLSIQSELAINYFLLRGIDAEKQLLARTLVAYGKALELTMNRHEGGIASDAEVAQAETQLKTAQVQAVNLGVQRAQLEHAIAVLLGKAPAEFAIPEAALETTPPVIPVGVPSELLERRPDIAIAERQVAAANAQVGVAKAAYYPTISLGATAGFASASASDWLNWPSRFWAIGPTATMTLFDGHRRSALNDQAIAAYDGTVAAYRQTVLIAFQDVEDNLAELRILAEEAQIQDAAVKAARRSVVQTTNRYNGGASSYLEVVVAQTFALTNERLAIDVSRRRMTASVRLVKAIGGGWSVTELPAGDAAYAERKEKRDERKEK
ncbi:MAG TPA: efflux transporter outer membrane subunit [Burkholderiales bacterium]|nr:efflux transporter outer membrane subunit [Burkholderiales bacterium]